MFAFFAGTKEPRTARAIAKLDVMAALSYVAERNQYVRPSLNEKGVIDMRQWYP